MVTVIFIIFSCSTPIVPVLRQVLNDKRNHIYERNLLIILATDGIPTDEHERSDTRTLEHVLRNERQPIDRIPVTIMVCTGTLNNISPRAHGSMHSLKSFWVLQMMTNA